MTAPDTARSQSPDATAGGGPRRGGRVSLPARGEEGTIALYMAIITVALLAMAGLVLDGGTAIAARAAAGDVAQEAARAGADARTPTSLRASNPAGLRVDPAAARTAAARVLAARHATGDVIVTGLDVAVVARIAAHTRILSAVGLNDLTGTGHATATVLHGTTTGGP